jgi:hypothetical protein
MNIEDDPSGGPEFEPGPANTLSGGTDEREKSAVPSEEGENQSRGSTGRTQALSQREEMAMAEAKANPESATRLTIEMGD